MAVDAARLLGDLHALASLTATEAGAQRVAWTDTWAKARAWERELLAELPVEVEIDEAGNLWATLEGERPETLVLGSHLDSVPDGGWLDGALGVLAALEVLRGIAASGTPRLTVKLVDWADEEGARFGFSLFGSSAFTGALDPSQVARLRDAEGLGAKDVLRRHGVDLDQLNGPDRRLSQLAAYLELHIEQGPVLEQAGLAGSAVSGTVGIERDRLLFKGQAAHAGPTPMVDRHDAFLAAAETALEIERLAVSLGGRATTGRLELEPGIPTAVAGEATLYCDLRHADAGRLAELRGGALDIAREAAERRGCSADRERIWKIAPRAFDPRLVTAAEAAFGEVLGNSTEAIESGALHDAAEIAPFVPTTMLFCASRNGLSHCPEEDSDERALLAACRAFDHLTRAVLRSELGSTEGDLS